MSETDLFPSDVVGALRSACVDLSEKLILRFLFPNLQPCVVKASLVSWTMYRPCPVSCEMSWVLVHTISLLHGMSWWDEQSPVSRSFYMAIAQW